MGRITFDYYKVRAYKLVGTTKIYGNFSSVFSAKPIPLAPTYVKAVRASTASIKSTWRSVAGASGYRIYRSTSRTGTYVYVKTTSSLSFTNTGLKKGKVYYYKVRAYKLVGTTKVYGNLSAVVYAKTY